MTVIFETHSYKKPVMIWNPIIVVKLGWISMYAITENALAFLGDTLAEHAVSEMLNAVEPWVNVEKLGAERETAGTIIDIAKNNISSHIIHELSHG